MTEPTAPPPSVPGPSAAAALRPSLFGDLPIEAWPAGEDATGEPWEGFIRARRHLADGDQDLAVREWSLIGGLGASPLLGYESRHILQAWHFLRSVGVQPDESIAGEVLGVVAEVSVDGAHDVLAAYADGSVRYLNHGGGATVVDDPPAEVAAMVTDLLLAGQGLAAQIGPWTEPALPDLPVGHNRLTMLTRGGHRFGQAPEAVLGGDAMALPVLSAATELLVAVLGLGPGA